MHQISRNIYSHQINEPPGSRKTSFTRIIFLQSEKNIILIKKTDMRHQTQYKFSIEKPENLRQMKSDNFSEEEFFQRILMSFNLLLKYSALTITEQNISELETHSEEIPIKVKKNTNIGKAIVANDRFGVKDYNIAIITKVENISESDVKKIYQTIENIEEWCDQLKLGNIKKSMDEYKLAMNSFDKISIFKHLFNSIEMAINYDGKDRKSDEYDKEIIKIISKSIEIENMQKDSLTIIKNWRIFYNQTKHSDKNILKYIKFRRNKKEMIPMLDLIRQNAQKIILRRLETPN